MAKGTPKRVVIVGMDGLRPDSVEPATMPRLSALLNDGTWFPNFRATYPSHTRVSMSSLTTGTRPGRHGLVNNLMYIPAFGGTGLVQTGDDRDLLAFPSKTGSGVLLVPSLAERLARRGLELAVVSAGTPGSALLWGPEHPEWIVNPSSTYGIPELKELHDRLGSVAPEPPQRKFERIRWATQTFVEHTLPNPQKTVAVLWLADPDHTQHHFGLGSPETLEALRLVDACLGRVLDTLNTPSEIETTLLVVSDHGHSTVGPAFPLDTNLTQALSELQLQPDSFISVGDFVYRRPSSHPIEGDLARLAQWFEGQPWCHRCYFGEARAELFGPLMTDRIPDLVVTPRFNNDPNPWGVRGHTHSLSTKSYQLSSHGSTSPWDLEAFCLAVGPSFGSGIADPRPRSLIDVAPTIFKVLGLEETGFDGEALFS